MTEHWTMDGQYLESCTCRTACPCLVLGSPTEGDCTGLVAWHIEDGHFGDSSLAGLNVAVALHSPGDMADGDWKVVLYLDQAADDAQREALAQIFGGQAGGHPALLAGFIGEVLGVEQVPIHFGTENGGRQLRIGESAATTLSPIEGQDGGTVTLNNHPLAVAPGHPLVAARSEALHHRAHGLEFEVNERAAYFSPFHYAGP